MADTDYRQQRLKIAMVIDAYDDGKNGAIISTKRFVELLRKEHEVYIITTGKPEQGKILLRKFYPPGVSGVMKKMQTPLAIPSERILKNAIREMHIVHVQFPFLLGVRSVRIARNLKKPVVTTFHIQAEHLAINAGIHSEKFIRYCYKFWIKYLYNPSDFVICPSQHAQDLLKYHGLTSPSIVISNGIIPLYKPGNFEKKENYSSRFVILSVGRYAPEKRQDLIIEAVNRSKYREDIQLILIGEGIRKEQLSKHGEVLPHPPILLTLPPEELVYYYNIADLYIHAASVEVEGMTVLEAMGCGLPILVADNPGSAAKQFALDSRSLFKGDDASDLVSKIEYWIEHPEELIHAGGLYHINSGNYTIDKSFAKLSELYSTLQNEHHLQTSR
jgi:1,2-diacylglycerol 3-alpha-glucosyltransferase